MTPDELLKQYALNPGRDDVQITHPRQLWQARYSPCGQYLVACGYDATLQRWNMTGDKPALLPQLTGHHGWVQSMDFVPQKKHVISADSWGRLSCWDYTAESTEPVWTLPEAHDGWIRCVAVSPDGATVATGGNGGVVRLWSTSDGKLKQELPHSHRVFSLRFHPQENAMATGDLPGVVRHWNLKDGKETRQFDAATLYNDETESKGRIQQCGGVRFLQFNQQGTQLACCGQQAPSGGFATGTPCVLVFDWKSGKLLREMPTGGAQDGFAYDVQFHPEGFVMATSSAFPGKGHVWFWRPEDEEAFYTSKKLPNGRSVSLHPDGTKIAHLISKSPNGNGRSLKGGEYPGGTAVITLLEFPAGE